MVQISLPASWIFFPNLKDFGFYDWLHYNKLFSVCFWILHISYFIKFPSKIFFLNRSSRGPCIVIWTTVCNQGLFWKVVWWSDISYLSDFSTESRKYLSGFCGNGIFWSRFKAAHFYRFEQRYNVWYFLKAHFQIL